MTSALVYQLVPLLWQQSYIKDVEMDYSRSYKITDNSIDPWAILSPEEGINLSPQPAMYRPDAPIPWTLAYAEIAGIKEMTLKDRIALPSLWNHRQWYWEHEVKAEGKKPWKPPKTCVIAPESETLKCIPVWLWEKVAFQLLKYFKIIIVGTGSLGFYDRRFVDLRGKTSVATIAPILAEAHLVICANSLPWHLARHAGTPTFCFQDQYLERCTPVDTPSIFYRSEDWQGMVEAAIDLSKNPRTTLIDEKDLEIIKAA